jgi:hypothetical protein
MTKSLRLRKQKESARARLKRRFAQGLVKAEHVILAASNLSLKPDSALILRLVKIPDHESW